MQKKEWLIALGVLILAVLVTGGIFFFNRGTSTQKSVTEAPQAAVPTLTPDQLGLTLVPRADKHALILTVTKISNISLIEYELDYTSTGDISQGAIGKLDIKPGQSKASQEIILGTCSDFCHYNTGVSDIKLTLKVTKTDGTVYSLNTTASLE